MADLLLDALPSVWEGRSIDPDFRHMVWLSNQIQRGMPEKDTRAFLFEAFRRFYREPVHWDELESAYCALCRFYAGIPDELGRSSGRGATQGRQLYDFHCDAPYLVAAFQQAYNIDLTTARLHWWRFKALFLALPEETRMRQILIIRGKNLSGLEPQERGRWEELQEAYALPDGLEGGKRIVDVQSHEEAFLARFGPAEG